VVTIRGQVLDRLNLKESLVFTLTGKLENLHALQSRLAWQLLQFLVSDVPPEEEYWQRRRAVRTDAMENYILGLQAGDIDKKFRLLTAAAHLDHWFAAPSLQLGKMNWERKEYSSASEWLVRVGAGDPGFNEAQFLLGLSQYHLGEFEKASEAFRRVAASIPLGEVWNNLGAAQSRLNLPEALESFRHAQEGDPLDPVYNFNTGYALWKNRDFEEAADRFRAVLSAIPEDMAATSMLGRCLQRASPGRTAMPVQPLERLKFNFDEMAYRQLKAALSGASKSGRDR
jgi:tetratricopeptide (TPR) repeat protein